MNSNNEKIVSFRYWCPLCKYATVPETEDPCNECMHDPVNLNSTKPVKFERKDEKSSVD